MDLVLGDLGQAVARDRRPLERRLQRTRLAGDVERSWRQPRYAEIERAVTQPLGDAGLALARQHDRHHLVEPRQVSGPDRVEETLERRIAIGELQNLGMGTPEIEPDLHHAL